MLAALVAAASCERGGPLRGLGGLLAPFTSPTRRLDAVARRRALLGALGDPSISQARDLGALSAGEADRFGAGAAMRSHILVRRTCLTHWLTEPRSVRAGRGFAFVARPRGVARPRATAPRSASRLRREPKRPPRPLRAPGSALSAARSGGETCRDRRDWLTQVTRWLTAARPALGPFDTEPIEDARESERTRRAGDAREVARPTRARRTSRRTRRKPDLARRLRERPARRRHQHQLRKPVG
jgi:hypothetical protein